MFRPFCVIVVIGLLLLHARPSLAQRTTSGTFGSRTLGAGVSGSAQSNRSQGLAQTGQVNSSAAIQRQAGSFVGASSGDTANFRSLSGGANAGFGARSGFGGGLGGSGNTGQLGRQGQGFGQTNQTGAAASGRRTIRAPIRLGFTPRPTVGTRVSTQMQTRFTKIPQLGAQSGNIIVKMEGRTVVLQGAVANEHQRRLAVRLALFEPGVLDVRNELKVDPSVAPLEELPLGEQR